MVQILHSLNLIGPTKTRVYPELKEHLRMFLFCLENSMAFRTVIIENEVDIKVKLNNLVLARKSHGRVSEKCYG